MKNLLLITAILSTFLTASIATTTTVVDFGELNINNDSSTAINITAGNNCTIIDSSTDLNSIMGYYADSAGVEASFSITNTPISFTYTNTTTDNKFFAKSYSEYIQPNGTNMYLHIATNPGDAVTLYMTEYTYGTATLEITGASQTSATLTGLEETLTLQATENEIVIKNTVAKYRLIKVVINSDSSIIIDPKIDYNINDTSTYLVSSNNFQALSPEVYLKSTENLTATIGGGDSIVNHYSKFIYDTTTVYTDTLQIIDSVTVIKTITDTLFVNDTITIFDTISITQQLSVTDTLIIEKAVTGLSTTNNNITIKIYPNPAKDYVIVNIDDYLKINNYSLTITNTSGQTVYSSAITSNSQSINIQDLGATGLYYIIIEDTSSNTFVTKQLIIK